MTSVARRNGRSASRDYSDASSDNSPAHSDNEAQDGDSEYGSAERSGSDLSDRESGEGLDEERKVDDASSQGLKSQVVDHDEDRRNPQYIPKRGTFYEHDDRTAAGGEDESVAEIGDGVASIDSSRTERGSVDGDEKGVAPVQPVERRKVPKSSADRWLHDKYNENDQVPKSSEELMAVYGYDIRGEEGPPKALRRHRYGRGPNKYTRNWEDENAYGKNVVQRSPKPPPLVTNGKEFPALEKIKIEKNNFDKRRKPEKKVRALDNKVAHDKNTNDKIIHDKVFINKTSKVEKDSQEKPVNDELPRWKSRGQPKADLRKPAIMMKNQTPLQDQMKWPEPPRSPPKPISLIPSQVQNATLPAMVPLQDNKLPPARKTNQAQVPPRMQAAAAAAASMPPAAVSATSAPATDAGTRGKRYSSLRQRQMPDTYQSHQPQYITDYQQPLPKQSSQQPLSNLGNIPHQQTPPPPLLQTPPHHQPIPQLHQQTPPPALHQSSPQLHQPTTQIHQQSQQLHQQSTQIHQQTPQIHQQNPQINQQSQQIHQHTPQLHPTNTQIHQQGAQMLQQTQQMHQQTPQLHQQSPSIHQQTPPPALQQTQTHHQTPPPPHQSISRQQATLPLRQVQRSHQQQLALHTMSMPQAGLVSSQTYATPQIMAQGQYIQGANGTVYGHVVPQVYPPPQAYAAPQHQPIPPQGIPPQALPPQAIPPQAIPPQALPPHSYHHQTPAPQHPSPYAAHTGRTVFREPSGITYYSPQEQKGTAPPTRRPTNAIPIVPPPPKERGKLIDLVPPPADNIDHIVDNMFVPRQGRTAPPRPGETPPRSLENPLPRPIEDVVRQLEEKLYEEQKMFKEMSPEITASRIELSQHIIESPIVTNISSIESKIPLENALISNSNEVITRVVSDEADNFQLSTPEQQIPLEEIPSVTPIVTEDIKTNECDVMETTSIEQNVNSVPENVEIPETKDLEMSVAVPDTPLVTEVAEPEKNETLPNVVVNVGANDSATDAQETSLQRDDLKIETIDEVVEEKKIDTDSPSHVETPPDNN